MSANGQNVSERLNTEDVKHALDLVVNLGKTPKDSSEGHKSFDYIFRARDATYDFFMSSDKFKEFAESDIGKKATGTIVKALDADGDGKLTPKDFQIMYDRDLMGFLDKHSNTLDTYLPFAGQCAFGVVAGLCVGGLARRMYSNKWPIVICGVAMYSGAQYVAQQKFVDQTLLEQSFRKKIKELADLNGDGEINREDLNALIENRMKFISTKLGPGGFAPGMTGYATFALGVLRGMRFI